MKKILIGIITVAVLGIIIYGWSTTRNIQVLQEMRASDFNKIEIWMADTPAVLTEQEDIQRFLDIVQSTHIHKRKMPDKAGSISVDLYYENGEQDSMAISSEHINVGDEKYKCDKDICDKILKLYEEFIEN